MTIKTLNDSVNGSLLSLRSASMSNNWKTAYIVIIVFILAFVPRVWALGTFVTRDEPYIWFGRSDRFLQAIQQGDYAATNTTGHPGVTTMWLGSAGLLLHQFLSNLGLIPPDDFSALVASMRFPVALITSVCVALAYPLLRRLFDQRLAFLSTLLWATEPFLVAHGRVLHLDGLLASFINVTLLAALIAFRFDGYSDRYEKPICWSFLVVSAVMGGFALLTKSPAVSLFPMLGIIAIGGSWQHNRVSMNYGPWSLIQKLRVVVGLPQFIALLLWVAIVLGVWFILWPALWVDLPGTVTGVVSEVKNNGGRPHDTGNFFLGRAVADPGWLFYPIAIGLRLTPWTTLGLVIAIIAGLSRMYVSIVKCHRMHDRQSWTVGILILFALLFTVMLSISPKKFDRYALSIVPSLSIFAAFGLFRGITWFHQYITVFKRSTSGNLNTTLLWIITVLLATGNLMWYHPYALAYYNPLFGGGSVAQHVIPVGWGEGLERVATYISGKDDNCDQVIASGFWPLMDLYSCSPVVPLDTVLHSDDVDYAVLYIDQKQRYNEPETIEMLSKQTPIHVERVHGIEYAYIYQIPQPMTNVLEVDFGSAIRLKGYGIDSTSHSSENVILLTLQWYVRASIDKNYMLFVHIIDAQGNRVGQIDVPPGGSNAPTSIWKPHHYVTWTHTIPIQADIRNGVYRIAIGIYNPHDLSRLPIYTQAQTNTINIGSDTLLLDSLSIR
jgi:4-amino-4-deoxy-L-arabinose transferase-like glycosyltransferase